MNDDDARATVTSRYNAVRARMNTGELYVDQGEGLEALEAERTHGKELLYDFNHTRPGQTEERLRLLRELLGAVGESVWIEPPFLAAYGSHVYIGEGFYANFNLVIVDDADVHIGDRVLFGPNVTITTAGHPVEPALRADGSQYSVPVNIEDDVWIGGNAVVMPGVTIGEGSVIGAGSVVTTDIPSRVVAVGIPCRVARPIGPEDQAFSFRPPGRAERRDVSGSRTRVLRSVEPDDIAVFFEQQADPEAAAMAAFPSRDRVAHDEHWARILGDSSCVARAIVLPDGQIVGNIGSFDIEGERHVGYWIGREHWGQGHATRALTELVAEFPERPLYAHVAEHNTASIRVLAKCGFVVVGEAQEAGDPVKEIVLRLS